MPLVTFHSLSGLGNGNPDVAHSGAATGREPVALAGHEIHDFVPLFVKVEIARDSRAGRGPGGRWVCGPWRSVTALRPGVSVEPELCAVGGVSAK